MAGKVVDFPTYAVSCEECSWSGTCIARGLPRQTVALPGLRCSAPIKRNVHVFRQGDDFDALYVLRSGSAKCYFDNADGLEQIVSFHYPGELLGFDALAGGQHPSSVVALETAALCRIPVQSLEALAADAPAAWAEITRAAARQLIERNNHVLMLGQKSAQARFASLLLSLSGRFAARGLSAVEFHLSMPRQDIANYLSLAVETVSRLFGELQQAGVIDVNRRHVRIRSLEALRRIAAEGAGASQRARSG